MMRVCAVFAALVLNIKVDLSFSETKQLYSIKFKNVHAHRQRKNKKELERVHERNIPRKFNMDSVVQRSKI